ncbi:hypothetical protein [Devosia sp.]|uniref:hypothetical protein n=1 Tax=Devosia sp. TaxID=1871048 RepID=UPI002AFE4CAA|nr:hypothetical protein [Devosia sp.]
MSDNVVKFRPRKPEGKSPSPRPPRPLPGWLPFAVLIAAGIAIYLVQQALGPG